MVLKILEVNHIMQMRSCFRKQGIKQYAIIEMLDKTYKCILWEHTNDQQYFYVVHDYEDISVWKLC